MKTGTYHVHQQGIQGQPSHRARWLFLLWMGVWDVANSLILTRFPYIHSDEPWLAGLSLAVLREKSLFVTEPFFDLFPRQPHALKILFHAIQSAFIQLFGFRAFSVRLVSLIAASVILVLLFSFFSTVFANEYYALAATMAFSVHIQFLYAAHFARQEILLLIVLVLAAWLYESDRPQRYWLIPTVIGLSATLHPNAFILAVMVGMVLLKDVLARRIASRRLLQYGGILVAFALALVGMSLAVTPAFLTNYALYGETLAVSSTIGDRWQNFIEFLIKIRDQISGSYWLPNLRFWFVLAVVNVLAATLVLILAGKKLVRSNRRGLENGLCGLSGFFVALFIIGRNNPTSILFALFPLTLLTGHLLQTLLRSRSRALKGLAVLIGMTILTIGLTGSLKAILPIIGENSSASMTIGLRANSDPYDTYLAEIERHLPEDSVVLGNLSAGFALADDRFYDIRNLDYRTDRDMAAYCAERQINVVIWYEEYDYILRNPQWRILYEEQSNDGAGAETLSALKELIEKQGRSLHVFESPVYGTRIIRYMGDYPWKVSLFAIDPQTIS